jgi:hypothetical protein
MAWCLGSARSLQLQPIVQSSIRGETPVHSTVAK